MKTMQQPGPHMLSAMISSSDAEGGAEAYMVRVYSLLGHRGVDGHRVGRMSLGLGRGATVPTGDRAAWMRAREWVESNGLVSWVESTRQSCRPIRDRRDPHGDCESVWP
jgi:hypothetical protein